MKRFKGHNTRECWKNENLTPAKVDYQIGRIEEMIATQKDILSRREDEGGQERLDNFTKMLTRWQALKATGNYGKKAS